MIAGELCAGEEGEQFRRRKGQDSVFEGGVRLLELAR